MTRNNLSNSFDLDKKYDWVISLEVGEHLPKTFEKNFIDNIHRHNTQGIILSWAIPGQGGHGHFNEQTNDYIKQTILALGYVNDKEAENRLRIHSTAPYFKNTIMVFRKRNIN